jgi:hypothetical protein
MPARDEILRAANALFNPGNVVELRIPELGTGAALCSGKPAVTRARKSGAQLRRPRAGNRGRPTRDGWAVPHHRPLPPVRRENDWFASGHRGSITKSEVARF